MIHYFDASAVVKRYVEEAGSAIVRRLLDEETVVGTSLVTKVEVASALSRRVRERSLPPAQRAVIERHFARDLQDLALVQLTDEVAQTAADLCAKHPLRAYDAVHLASALVFSRSVGQPISFVTSDAQLARSAASEGMQVVQPSA